MKSEIRILKTESATKPTERKRINEIQRIGINPLLVRNNQLGEAAAEKKGGDKLWKS